MADENEGPRVEWGDSKDHTHFADNNDYNIGPQTIPLETGELIDYMPSQHFAMGLRGSEDGDIEPHIILMASLLPDLTGNGQGLMTPLNIEQARDLASQINVICDNIEAGVYK